MISLNKPIPETLEEIRKMLSETTPSPWGFDTDDLGSWINLDEQGIATPIAKMGMSKNLPTKANGEWIAESKEIVGYLLKLVQIYREQSAAHNGYTDADEFAQNRMSEGKP